MKYDRGLRKRSNDSAKMSNKINYIIFYTFFFSWLIFFIKDPLVAKDLYGLSSSSWERQASLEAQKKYQDRLREKRYPVESRKSFSKKDLKDNYPKNDFIVFLTSINNKVFKYNVPRKNEVGIDRFNMFCAKNEWESIQIGIWALRDLKNFSYEISDLVHENNQDTIPEPGKNVRKYYAYNVLVKEQDGKEASPDMDIDPEKSSNKIKISFREEPVVLMDLPGIDIEADTAQALWLDIHITKDVKEGIYRGNIVFRINGEKTREYPLSVTVHPFELDEAKDWSRGAYISKFVDQKEAVNLFENGHNQVSWWTSGGYSIKLQGQQILADFSPFSEYLKMLEKVGITGPHVVFLGGDSPKIENEIFRLLGRKEISNGRNERYRSQYVESDLSPPFEFYLAQVLKQYHQQMKACGHGDILSVLLDEPDHKPNPERLNWYNKIFSIAEKQIPELPTMGVFYHKGDEGKLSHHHSVWSTNRPSIELYNTCKKANKRLYTYHGGYQFYDSPGKFRFSVGIIPWVYEAAGTFYWAIWNHSDEERIKDDIFSPDEFGGQSTTIVRAPLNSSCGPLSTLIHKGFREAVDDARYIRTLEKMINASIGTSREKKALQHRKWLLDIQSQLRRKMVIRGGHLENHKKRSGLNFPIASLEFKNMKNEVSNMENLDAFSEFIRRDVTNRILDIGIQQ